MGKEWLYWVGGNGGDGSGGGKSANKRKSGGAEREAPTPGCMCAVFQLFDLHHFQYALNHQTSLKTDPFLQFQDEPLNTVAKGVEAPRNSLELADSFAEAACLSSSAIKEERLLNIPMGIQIKTSCENRSPRASTSSSKAKGEDLFSECSSSSPGAKTPNLVARLMGLDLLPESGSPSLSSSRLSTSNSIITNSHMNPPRHSKKQEHSRSIPSLQTRHQCSHFRNSFSDNDITGSVSLPETPRISMARRSDVEHRLSLQMNRESIGEELELSTKKMGRRRDVRLQDENRSPGSYARNIVKQVRESVSRKVGLDITNTLKSREQRRDDDHVVLLKPKKPSPILTRVEDDDTKQTTPSCSPRFRFLDPKNKAITSPITSKTQASQSPRLSPLSVSTENQSQVQEGNVLPKPRPQGPVHKSVQKCKKAGNERFNSRLRNPPTASDAIRNKKEEPFVRSTTTNKASILENNKKCKRTPLSNQLLPVRKDSSLPLSKLRDNQVSDGLSWERSTTRLSSCASRSYCQEEVTHTLIFQEKENIHYKRMCNGTSSSNSVDIDMEFQYVQRILKRAGLEKATPVSLAKWFSPSHPLDPSIFHYIELFHPTTNNNKVSRLSHRSNRKLIFQLVNELLVEILNPYINPNPWITPASVVAGQSQMLYGSELIGILCRRINNFPSANCQVLEDIDALIGKDLRNNSQVGTSLEAYEEVGERIASEIERDIIERLVHETATMLSVCPCAHLTVRHGENKI